MNQKSLIIGIITTIVWFVGIYLFCSINEFSFSNKDLNSLGDFLAGIFAPVAFFWLILGYIQQGRQLEQNTKALEQQERALQLQIDEMKESVKQQKELAEIQKEHLTSMYGSVRPDIRVRNGLAILELIREKEYFSIEVEVFNAGSGQALNILLKTFVNNKTLHTRDIQGNSFLAFTLDKGHVEKINFLLEKKDFYILNDDDYWTLHLELQFNDIYNVKSSKEIIGSMGKDSSHPGLFKIDF